MFSARAFSPAFAGAVPCSELIISVAGVDRTSAILVEEDLSFEDVRTPGSSSLLLSFKPVVGWKPAWGMVVTLMHGGRTLFAGEITHVADARHGLTWGYDVTVTGKVFLLRTVLVWKRYTGATAGAILADLMTRAPAGFSATHLEAGLGTIPDIIFDGIPLEDAIQEVCAQVGAIGYFDETGDLHAYITADSGVETPATVTLENTRPGIQRIVDATQIVTRVYVEGQSRSLPSAAPVFPGDRAVPIDDVSIFPVPGVFRPASVGAAPVAYTGRVQGLSSPIQTGIHVTEAGDFYVELYQDTGLPPQGWLRTAAGALIRYVEICPWMVGVILPGAAKIQSIVRAGGVATVTTQQPYLFNGAANQVVSFAATGDPAYDNNAFPWWPVDATRFAFNAPSGGNVGARGICGVCGWWAVGSVTWAAGAATVNTPSGHRFVVGDWATITGNSQAAYNGVWQVTGVNGYASWTFALPNSHPTGLNGTCQWAGAVPVSLPAATGLNAVDMLTGVTNAPSLAPGSSVAVFVQCDDLAAQAALAAATGGSGIRVGPVISAPTLPVAALQARGQAELLVRSGPETRLAFSSFDPKIRAGMTVTAAVTPPGITGSHKVTRVRYSGFKNLPFARIVRDVETTDRRFTADDLFRQGLSR